MEKDVDGDCDLFSPNPLLLTAIQLFISLSPYPTHMIDPLHHLLFVFASTIGRIIGIYSISYDRMLLRLGEPKKNANSIEIRRDLQDVS